eukprot:382402-Pelagomonas_calceolata.AAC.3
MHAGLDGLCHNGQPASVQATMYAQCACKFTALHKRRQSQPRGTPHVPVPRPEGVEHLHSAAQQ